MGSNIKEHAVVVNRIIGAAWERTLNGEHEWSLLMDMGKSRTFRSSLEDWTVMISRDSVGFVGEETTTFEGWVYEPGNTDTRIFGDDTSLFAEIFQYCNAQYIEAQKAHEGTLAFKLEQLATALNCPPAPVATPQIESEYGEEDNFNGC